MVFYQRTRQPSENQSDSQISHASLYQTLLLPINLTLRKVILSL